MNFRNLLINRLGRHLSMLSLALGMLFLFNGCDSAYLEEEHQDDHEHEEGPTSCGGAGVLCTVSGVAGELGGNPVDGIPAVEAHHYWPMDVTLGPDNMTYVVDWNNHCVWRIDSEGRLYRFIGAGTLGDDSTGPADGIDLNHPTSLTIGPDGNYYLASWHNWKIKLIDKSSMMTSAPVGTTQGLEGDGGSADHAKMDLPSSLVFDAMGNMFISDQGNQRIRKVDTQGVITTFVGSGKGFADGVGTEAMFSAPVGPDASPGLKIAIDPDLTALYVADTDNNRIRKVDLATAEVTTIAGTGEAGYSGDGGPALGARLNRPTDVVFTHDNEIYFADSENHVVRKIDAAGNISTVAGTGEPGVSPDGTPALEARLNRPMGLTYDEAHHTLYIADTFNHQVKRVELDH